MEEGTNDLLKEIIVLLAIQAKREISNQTLIEELGKAGIQPKRIAEITGVNPNTVRGALHRLKKKT